MVRRGITLEAVECETGKVLWAMENSILSKGRILMFFQFLNAEYDFFMGVQEPSGIQLYRSNLFRPFFQRERGKVIYFQDSQTSADPTLLVIKEQDQFFLFQNYQNSGPLAYNEDFTLGSTLFRSSCSFDKHLCYVKGSILVEMEKFTGKKRWIPKHPRD